MKRERSKCFPSLPRSGVSFDNEKKSLADAYVVIPSWVYSLCELFLLLLFAPVVSFDFSLPFIGA